MPLIKPFLHSVQVQNKRAVNNAINDLLIEEEDYKTLRDSVENYDNYDPVTLAQRLEKHELVFFRQIAASIYRKNKRWDKSISLSKQDKLFKDAIETAAISSKREVAVELLRYVGVACPCSDIMKLTTLVRRHRQQRVLRRHALCLLRPGTLRRRDGALMAPRPQRLHHGTSLCPSPYLS